MSGRAAFSVVVPCYNEAASLPALLAAFDGARGGEEFELILVDNGSTDGTAGELARLLPLYSFARAVRVPVNRGYGYGIMQGLGAASGGAVGWIHADLQFDPAAVFTAWRLLDEAGGKKIFVKGLRLGRPLADRFFTGGMAAFESLCLGRPLRDINGQPTLFSRELLESWERPPEDFLLDLYACATASRAGFREIRFGVRTLQRLHGGSTWNRGLRDRLALARRVIAASLALRRRFRAGGA